MLGRGALSGFGGVAGLLPGLLLGGGQGGFQELPQSYWDSRYANPTLPDLDIYPGGFDALLPGAETPLSPGLIGSDPANWVRGLGASPSDAPVSIPETTPLRTYRRAHTPALARYLDLDLVDTRDVIDNMPSTVMPAKIRRIATQTRLLHSIDIYRDQAGMRVKTRTRSVDPKYDSRKRDGDQKVGRAGYRRFLFFINHTYGTVSEVQDFLDALRLNSWVQLPSGQIVNLGASDVSTFEYARMMMSGMIRVDMPGLALDVAYQQMIDTAAAMDPVDFAQSHAPVWLPGTIPGQPIQTGGNYDVSAPLIQELRTQRASSDPYRSFRVSQLFASP